VEVTEGGALSSVQPAPATRQAADTAAGTPVAAGLAGNVFKVLVGVGDVVNEGQPILIVEAMKMETEVSSPRGGTVSAVHVEEGDAVAVGEPLISLQ
jgi:oxaloacetate decarboxylase alpha subunit